MTKILCIIYKFNVFSDRNDDAGCYSSFNPKLLKFIIICFIKEIYILNDIISGLERKISYLI